MREYCMQSRGECVSKSSNKVHQTWGPPFSRNLYNVQQLPLPPSRSLHLTSTEHAAHLLITRREERRERRVMAFPPVAGQPAGHSFGDSCWFSPASVLPGRNQSAVPSEPPLPLPPLPHSTSARWACEARGRRRRLGGDGRWVARGLPWGSRSPHPNP